MKGLARSMRELSSVRLLVDPQHHDQTFGFRRELLFMMDGWMITQADVQ